MKNVFGLLTSEDGATLAEYSLVVGLIAIVVIGTVTLFGGTLVTSYRQAAQRLAGA